MSPVLLAVCLLAFPADPPPTTLENAHLRLEFDPVDGDWTGLVDLRDGSRLTSGGRSTVVPQGGRRLDADRLKAAAGSCVDLAGDWLYTPEPPAPAAKDDLLAGRFDGVAWKPTPIPSRIDAGDGRLKDRAGDFWYRRTFDAPPDLGASAALLIGAVDDFDAAYLNGVPIGRTGVETPRHWETPRLYRFPARLLKADAPNVLLVRVTNGAFEGGIAGPVLIGPAEVLESAAPGVVAAEAARQERGRSPGAATLATIARGGGYEFRVDWTLPDDASRFSRRLTVANVSDREQVFESAAYATPALAIGTGAVATFPGSLPVGDVPAASGEVGEALRPRGMDPLIVLWDEASRRGLGSWFVQEDEFSPVQVVRTSEGPSIRHVQQVIAKLKPGASVVLGDQHFWLARGSRDAALAGVQDVYRAVGLRAPDRAPAGLRSMVLYCGHPGGTPELGYIRYGGFQALEAYLPTLADMGVDVLWMLPVWEHGDGSKWNLYGPSDHFRVSELYGGEAALSRLSDAARGRKIRLLFDLVPHGPPDESPLAKEHPEWSAFTREGKPAYEWGQLAFDNAHPGWQDYFRRVAESDASRFDALGARVDCAAGGPLNWKSDRPSRSGLGAGLEITRAIREGFLRSRPDVLIIPEEYTGQNIYYRISDLTYDAQLYFLTTDLLDRKAPPEEWAASLSRFLHDQALTIPPGALKMRWISNHDTVSWTFQKKRPLAAYGVDRMRSLMALCALVEGVPMLYQGDEDPAVYGGEGPSSVAFLKAIYTARKGVAPIAEGTADYASVRASGGVFACLRARGEEKALVLIGFNPGPVRSAIAASAGVLPAGPWRDALGGEAFGSLEGGVPMAPHQVRILVRR
ncbi:MAG: hypothetical protein BGO49_16470 [Planctomycetales bacterium 71-10]|nr:MAG: hypothetical protein BGO49_16470 [Planctomycetales bacterium 71-10]